MSKKTEIYLPYKEGTWFAIPLRQGGFAVGIVARLSGNGCIYCYFFGPRRRTVPTLNELETYSADTAIKALRASDLGIIEGKWPIIGNSNIWNRDRWPIPLFLRIDEIGKTAQLVEYADDNPMQVVAEYPIPFDTTGYERDTLSGAGAAEVHISHLAK